ncbi:hypothetical protein ACTHGU_08365 [Chitinophagaceae bacterium MMS25-I14]
MQLIHFFATYFLFLLASSILITSFFCVTRGFTEILPDGTVKRYGKILKGYYFFWFKEKGKHRIYFTDDRLAELAYRMREYYPEPLAIPGDPYQPGSANHIETTDTILKMIPLLRNKLEVQFETTVQPDGRIALKVYEEYTDYIFPEWLRTVMAGCITCTPTIYGNIIYWTTICIFRKTIIYDTFFNSFNSPLAGILFVWLAYWVSLAWLNTVLWKLYDR